MREGESICDCGCNTKESRIQRGTKEPEGREDRGLDEGNVV